MCGFVMLSAMLSAMLPVVLVGCGTSSTSGTGGGTGVQPQVTVSPTTLAFGTVGLGASSSAQSVTVTNSGTVTVTSLGIAGSGDFVAGNDACGTTLAAGASCTVTAAFAPTATGSRTGTLSVTSNATTQTVGLSGTGGTSSDSLSAGSLSFGSVVVGSSGAAQTLTVTSNGTAALDVTNVALSGDFAQTMNTCGYLVASSTSCQISVVFTPSVTGARSGVLTLTSNSAGSPQMVTLGGTGVSAATYAGTAIQVQVLAGTQPMVGAAVQLYAAGTTGDGSGSMALLGSALTTNASGLVTIPGSFVCPSAGALVYAVSTGGSVGSGGTPNGNVKMVTAIGPCNGLVAGGTYVVDEASTVAAAYSLAQFYGAGGVIGATATNQVGLTNAFATAGTLTDPVAGTSPGSALPSNGASPAVRVNALANVLNACVVTSSECGALFSATTASGSAAPANTLDAMVSVARNPAANVATLYGQSLLSTAYAPVLKAAPADWTMFVTYSGGGLNSPSGIGVDSTGSVWVASYFNAASKFSPIGAAVFSGGVTGDGLNNSYGLAVDLGNNAWVPNEQPFTASGIGSVTELSPTGVGVSGSGGYQAGGLNFPTSVAVDPDGTVWVVDYGNSHVTLLNELGTPLSGSSGYTTPLFAFPIAVVVDGSHFGWVANQSGNSVTKISPDGSNFVNYPCCNGASGLAVDQGNNMWVANYYGNSVSLISSAGTVVSAGTYTGGGSLNRPQGIAVDGAGNVWVANYRAGYLTELAGVKGATVGALLTPVTGVGGDANLLEAYALALDASGNIWVSNLGSNTVTKFIGLASPVRTPLAGLPVAP